MSTWLPNIFTAFVVLLCVFLALSVAATRSYYRRRAKDRPLSPMTVIRPLRGADPGLSENLRSLIVADHEGAIQTLFAMETADDPAYPICERIVRDFLDRDIEIILTGPSGSRMGKAHNMIEAFKRAKHPVVVFSDSDVRAGRDVLAATSEAFDAGADAASAMLDGSKNRATTDVLLAACFNHYFGVPATLLYRMGLITAMAGGWIACRKEFFERLGGIETLADRAAEDATIALAARRLGAKAVLLPAFAPIYESGGSTAELIRHILKWAKIIRFTTPVPYALLPLIDPVFIAVLACLFGAPWSVVAFAVLCRIVFSWLQDRGTTANSFPTWLYLSLPLLDLICVVLWLAAYASNTIEWRGKRYRLRAGGRLEVLSA